MKLCDDEPTRCLSLMSESAMSGTGAANYVQVTVFHVVLYDTVSPMTSWHGRLSCRDCHASAWHHTTPGQQIIICTLPLTRQCSHQIAVRMTPISYGSQQFVFSISFIKFRLSEPMTCAMRTTPNQFRENIGHIITTLT